MVVPQDRYSPEEFGPAEIATHHDVEHAEVKNCYGRQDHDEYDERESNRGQGLLKDCHNDLSSPHGLDVRHRTSRGGESIQLPRRRQSMRKHRALDQ